MQNIPGKQLKQLDLSQKEFEANGKKYLIETRLSFDRFQMHQLLQIELGLGVSVSELIESQKKIISLCNSEGGNKGSVAIIAQNNIDGIATIGKRQIKQLEMCALFINEENEDRTIITDEMVQNKINDWRAEGYDVESFFPLAVASMGSYRQHWNEIILSSSES